jgi:putative transposase
VDNGKIYRSQQLARIGASLGILIVHTPPYQPEGRGKIERFFRTVREQFLDAVDVRKVHTLEDLNARFQTWLETVYHRTVHSAIQMTPLARWQRDIEQVRQLPPSTDLGRLFLHRADRLVRRDSTVLIHKRFYEVSSHLSGRRVEVRFDPLDLTQIEIHVDGQFEGHARIVDTHVNAQLPPRAKHTPETGASTGINYVEMLQKKEGGDV